MKSDGRVVIDTTLNNKGFVKGVQGLAGNLKSVLGKVGLAMGVALGVNELVKLGKQAVELGSNIAEVQNVVDTAFGDMAYKIEEFADSAIENFGMSKLSAKQTASTYMAMAKGMGIASDKASDMAVALTGLTGDIASFYNITQAEADTKLKSVFTGETETLKSLGIVMTQTNLDAYAMANGFGKTTKAMSQAELVALRYAYVTDKLGMAAGDFAKTSNSWANQTRILSERWKEFLSLIGDGLIRVLTPAVKLLNEMMNILISFGQKFSDLTKAFFGEEEKSAESIKAATAAEEDLTAATEAATEAAKRQAAGFDEMNILSAGNNAGAGTASAESAVTVSPKVEEPDTKPAITGLKKVQKVMEEFCKKISTDYAESIESWSGAFKKVQKTVPNVLDKVGTKVSNLWENTLKPTGKYIADQWAPNVANSFSKNFAPIFGDTMPWLLEELGADFNFFCDQINSYVQDIWVPGMEILEKAGTDAMNAVGNEWDRKGNELLKKTEKVREGLRDLWNSIYATILKPIIDNIAKRFDWLWDAHLKELWQNLLKMFTSIGECVLAIWEGGLLPLANFLVDVFGPVISAVINSILDAVFYVVGWIADKANNIVKVLTALLGFITGVFSGDWEKAWKYLKKAVEIAFEGLWTDAKYFINLIITAFNQLWKLLYSAIAGVINGVGSIAKSIGKLIGQDWGWKVPTNPPVIPKLAQGAVIPANQSFLAVLGDQKAGRNLEAPESLIRQIVREESGGGSGPITVILKVGTHTLGKVVIDSINELTKQNGQLSLALE